MQAELLDSNFLQTWHWFALAIVIFIIEVFGAAGFFLGVGVAALVISIILTFTDSLIWQLQVVIFAVLSVTFTLIYWKKFRKFNLRTEQPLLNSGPRHYIGREFTVLDVIDGQPKVQIADALWTIECDESLVKGSRVKVVDVKGAILIAESIAS